MIKRLFIFVPLFFMMAGYIAGQGQNKIMIPNMYRTVDYDSMKVWVDSALDKLTPEERIGQLFMIITFGTPSSEGEIVKLVENQHVGGIIFLKGTPYDQAKLTNAAQKAARIPLMIGLDGEWGLSMRLENTIQYPRNMMLGAIQNDSLLYHYGREVARQCREMGIHVNFAPDMDVNSNEANPVIGNRSYGESPELVTRKGIMYAQGLESGRVLSVAKHFPGHGDTSTDSHYTLPVINSDRERLDRVELYPFRGYIDAGLSGMMPGHLFVPALDSVKQPSSLSRNIVTGLLRDEYGFNGLVFTDGLAMKGISDETDHCVRALLAGNDILLGPVAPAAQFEAVKKAVKNGVISQELIDIKCRKVLEYKYMLDIHKTTPIETASLPAHLNTAYGTWLSRKLNEKAMTLLKNEKDIVPLKELDTRKIAAVSVGSSANNAFHNTLRKYGDITCFNVADNAGLLALKKELAAFNTVIISVHANKANADTAIGSIIKDKQSILTFFLVPYRMSSYASSIGAADGLVLAYEDSDFAQEFAAQAIFGGNGMDGKIPVSVKGLFKEGDGLNTEKIRLSYNLPEELGLNSQLFTSIDSIVYEGIAGNAYPGCQVLVAKNGVVIYDRAFGTFQYDKKKRSIRSRFTI